MKPESIIHKHLDIAMDEYLNWEVRKAASEVVLDYLEDLNVRGNEFDKRFRRAVEDNMHSVENEECS